MLSRTFGCVRLVWNKTLADRRQRYAACGQRVTYKESSAALTDWKKNPDMAFLGEVSCVPLQQTLRHQDAAFKNFFSGRSRYPRFKSRSGRQSAHFTRSAFRMREGELFLAKSGAPLRFVWSFDTDLADLDPTTVVVSREPDGRWYVTFVVDIAAGTEIAPTGSDVGVDLGLKDLAVFSTGERVGNPKHLERKARNLARYQRRLARKKRGSANRDKARRKVARTHRKVRNARADFLHRLSAKLVRDYDLIAVEDLNVQGMMHNRRLARAIGDSGWGELRRQIEYKAARSGRTVAVVDRWFPSSKMCSDCGNILEKLDLGTRVWTCPDCRTRHDRDINAARNILAAGRAVARDFPGDACGADVRRSGFARARSATKQET